MRRDDLLRRLRQSLQAEGVGDRAAGPSRSNDSEPRAHCAVVGGIRRTRRNSVGTDSWKKAKLEIPSGVRGSFQYAADFRKLAAQAGAEACQCDDERDRYQTGDQCIFDSGGAAVVVEKLSYRSHR